MLKIRISLTYVFLAFMILSVKAESVTLKELQDTGLMLLIIDTEGQENPRCEYVEAPEGSIGRGITDNDEVSGRLRVILYENLLYDSKEYEEGKSGMTIRVRGNSSAWTEKKPYKIKLQKKADLLFRGDDDYKDKSWLLIKDSESMTLKNEMSLKPLVGLKISELIGMEWTPSGRYVNLVLNDAYMGIYFLIESVKESKKRVNLSKDTGFLIEYDPYWWNEDISFDTDYTSSLFKFTFKEPDDDNITDEFLTYVNSTMLVVENSLEDNTFINTIDLESFAKWMLAMDILGSDDAGGVNKFLYKFDSSNSSLVKMGPLWDFDGIMKKHDSFSEIHTLDLFNFYYSNLLKKNRFVKTYSDLWNKIKDTIFIKLYEYLDDFAESEYGKSLNSARYFEKEIWNEDYKSVDDNINEIKMYFDNRYTWLTNALNEIEISAEYIKRIPNKENNKTVIFDLLGRITLHPNGFYIQDGVLKHTKF